VSKHPRWFHLPAGFEFIGYCVENQSAPESNNEDAENAFVNELAIAIAAIAREIYADELAKSKESAPNS
jgi:hypothetical protein